MGLDNVLVLGQSDVEERSVLKQLFKNAWLVFVPAEAQMRRAKRRRFIIPANKQ